MLMSDQSRGFKWKHVISSCFFAVWVSTQFKEVEILIHVALRALSVFNNWLPEYFSATSISRNSRTTVVLLSRHIWRRFWLGIWLGTTPSASLRNKASFRGLLTKMINDLLTWSFVSSLPLAPPHHLHPPEKKIGDIWFQTKSFGNSIFFWTSSQHVHHLKARPKTLPRFFCSTNLPRFGEPFWHFFQTTLKQKRAELTTTNQPKNTLPTPKQTA